MSFCINYKRNMLPIRSITLIILIIAISLVIMLIYSLFAPFSSFNSFYFPPDGVEINLKLDWNILLTWWRSWGPFLYTPFQNTYIQFQHSCPPMWWTNIKLSHIFFWKSKCPNLSNFNRTIGIIFAAIRHSLS